MPRVVRRYHVLHPGNELAIDTIHGAEIVSRLLKHDLDLGIVFGSYEEKGLTSCPIAEVPLLLIDASRNQAPVRLEEIEPDRCIGLSEGDPTARLLDIAWEEAGREMVPSVRVRTHYMAAELVRLGAGCAIVDALTALHHPGLPKPLPLDPALSVTCSVLYRDDYAISHISKDILTILEEEVGRELAGLAS